MAKGWSFGGLVKALKSAAFRNVGVGVGDVIEIAGPLGIGSKVLEVKRNFNWQTYTFAIGEVLYVEYSSMVNRPKDLVFNTNSFVFLNCVGCTDVGGSRVNVSTGLNNTSYTVSISGALGSRTMAVTSEYLALRDMKGTEQTPNVLVNYKDFGVFGQSDSSLASAAVGYPIQEAGTLQVLPSGPDGVSQIYTATSGRMFFRTGNETATTPWQEYSRVNSSITGVRHAGQADLTIGAIGHVYTVPSGCVVSGWIAGGAGGVGDRILYTQEQVYIASLGGWLNINRV